MTLASMTGFARGDGAHGALRWTWEIRSVNGRGLEVRGRVPPGFDAVEAEARTRLAARLTRGNCNINLSVTREAGEQTIRINEDVLLSLVESLRGVQARAGLDGPVAIEGLLGVRGVIEQAEAQDDEADKAQQAAAVLASFDAVLERIAADRAAEGAALARVLTARLDEIETLTRRADEAPARRPEAIRARLAEQIRAIIETGAGLDPDRLHQEALILAAKADIREELDRLHAHVAAGRELIAAGGAVGRRLDFLAQELGRETNTLCSKSNHVGLTAIGLELKAVVEQFREQVQNIE